jgi:surface polysaccharide O-acyltransferase-like enzyme
MATVTMKQNYILKVWGSSVLAAPVLMMIITAVLATKQGSTFDAGALGFIAFALCYGFILSLPAILIVYLLFPFLRKKIANNIKLKLSVILIGVACVLATFYFLYGGDGYNLDGNYAALTFSAAYSICLVVFSLIYPVADKEAQPTTNKFSPPTNPNL